MVSIRRMKFVLVIVILTMMFVHAVYGVTYYHNGVQISEQEASTLFNLGQGNWLNAYAVTMSPGAGETYWRMGESASQAKAPETVISVEDDYVTDTHLFVRINTSGAFDVGKLYAIVNGHILRSDPAVSANTGDGWIGFALRDRPVGDIVYQLVYLGGEVIWS